MLLSAQEHYYRRVSLSHCNLCFNDSVSEICRLQPLPSVIHKNRLLSVLQPDSSPLTRTSKSGPALSHIRARGQRKRDGGRSPNTEPYWNIETYNAITDRSVTDKRGMRSACLFGLLLKERDR